MLNRDHKQELLRSPWGVGALLAIALALLSAVQGRIGSCKQSPTFAGVSTRRHRDTLSKTAHHELHEVLVFVKPCSRLYTPRSA